MTPFEKVFEFLISFMPEDADASGAPNSIRVAGMSVATIFDHVLMNDEEIEAIEFFAQGSIASYKERCVSALKIFRKFGEEIPITETALQKTETFIEYVHSKVTGLEIYAGVSDHVSVVSNECVKVALLTMHKLHQRDPKFDDHKQRQNFNCYVDALLSKELPPVDDFHLPE